VLLAVVLLVVAGALVVLGGDDDDGSSGDRRAGGSDDGSGEDAGTFVSAAEACTAFEQRLLDELELSFPEGAPTPEAEAEYLSHAFADTTEELVATLRAIDPDGAEAAVDALDDLVQQLRDDPTIGVGANPFAPTVAPAFDAAGLPECGSAFLGGPN
jgi:hypothetical protein